MGEDAPHEAAVVLVLRVPDGLLLGQGLGQLLPAASRLVGRRGRVQSDLGKRERSSATSNFVLMRADGDAGLTIHGASLRK